jgi:hypothetical protein
VPKYGGGNNWSNSWPTRREARARVKKKQAWNCALARRSAIILCLEPGVDTMELPDRWPTIVQGEHKYMFGVCEFPTRESKRHAHIHASPMCSPATFDPEVAIETCVEAETANVAVAARYEHAKTTEIKIQPQDNPEDTPSGVRNSAAIRDMTKTTVRVGYMRVRAVPTHPRGAPDRCFGIPARYEGVGRRQQDPGQHLRHANYTRPLCTEALRRNTRIGDHTFYCDHPQHIATVLTDVATPGAGVRMSRTIKAQRDFGMRR